MNINFRITVLIFLLAVVFPMVARSVEHTVQRGETVESIAAKYGVSAADILSGNGMERIYVGLKLDINVPDQQLSYSRPMAPNISSEEKMLADKARRQMESENYGDAVKSYNKLIKKYPCSAYYFNRGIAQFQRGKNRQAANDLREALRTPGCNEYISEHAPELIEVADARHAQWKEEQSQIWGSIVATAVGVGLETWATVETAKAYADVAPVYYSYDTANSGNMQAVQNQLLQLSLAQSQAQMEQQNAIMNGLLDLTFQQVAEEKNRIISQYKAQCQQWGYTPTDWECEKYYSDVIAAKNGTYTESDDTSGDSVKGNSKTDANSNNTNVKFGEKTMSCYICHGTGKCNACNGSKVARGLGQTYHCNVCNDDGTCPKCDGKGEIPDLRRSSSQ